MRGNRMPLLGLLATAMLLAAAGPASAALLATPLRLEVPGGQHVQVGDDVLLRLGPVNDTARQEWAGKPVRLVWRDIHTGEVGGVLQETLVLGSKAQAEFTWRIPAEVKDKNVFVSALDKAETLADLHLRIGDAEEVAFTLGGKGAPHESGPAGNPGGPGSGSGAGGEPTAPGNANRVPGPGAAMVLVALAGIAAVLVAVRPGR